jgi:hypothetical protein
MKEMITEQEVAARILPKDADLPREVKSVDDLDIRYGHVCSLTRIMYLL